MKEHPILFSTPMVQGLSNDTKTMTRRVTGLDKINKNPDDFQFEFADYALKYPYRFTQISSVNYKSLAANDFHQEEVKCPYGKPGDLMWVRETFSEKDNRVIYRADVCSKYDLPDGFKWKPSIHMPKAAARFWLRITDIRIERLHNITEEDAKAEGAEYLLWRGVTKDSQSYRNGFTSIWLSINCDASWNKNPWVWVVSFEILSKIGKPVELEPITNHQ